MSIETTLRQETDPSREILLKHAKHPSNLGDTSDLAGFGQCKNPLCGDFVSVGVDLENDAIKKIRIQPTGCGISIASASLMSELVTGLTTQRALELNSELNLAFTAKTDWPVDLAKLAPLSRLRENPTKVPCALIGWFALKAALEKALKSAAPKS